MIVTVINPDAPYDSPAYDGEPAGAHLRLIPGEYVCDYADADDNTLWGTLIVTDSESHMVTGGPTKPVGDLVDGDRISFPLSTGWAVGTVASLRVRSSYAPDADPDIQDFADLAIRTDDGVLHERRGWHVTELVDMAADGDPAAITTAVKTTTVIAEDAPIGVLLWPVRSPEGAPNFTLATVEIVRNVNGSFIRWTYESGATRVFPVGEAVAVRIAA